MRPAERGRQHRHPWDYWEKGAVNSCTSSGSKGTSVMDTQQKGAGGGEIQPLPGAQNSLEPGGVVGRLCRSQTFSKTPFMSTELPEDGVTPRGCWNREGLQQEEMDPISSSLMLFSANVTWQKTIPQRQGLISVKRPQELQGNRKSQGRIWGAAFFWVERKGNPPEDMQGTKTHTKETERGKKMA